MYVAGRTSGVPIVASSHLVCLGQAQAYPGLLLVCDVRCGYHAVVKLREDLGGGVPVADRGRDHCLRRLKGRPPARRQKALHH